jgi:hypothetical protein
MNTAKQAMENREYVRRLLEEKQPEFAASLELAVSFIHSQIERPEETMELTLSPGRHETIGKQDPVHEWRVARLARLGIPWPVAEAAAGQIDWHQMAALVQRCWPTRSACGTRLTPITFRRSITARVKCWASGRAPAPTG